MTAINPNTAPARVHAKNSSLAPVLAFAFRTMPWIRPSNIEATVTLRSIVVGNYRFHMAPATNPAASVSASVV